MLRQTCCTGDLLQAFSGCTLYVRKPLVESRAEIDAPNCTYAFRPHKVWVHAAFWPKARLTPSSVKGKVDSVIVTTVASGPSGANWRAVRIRGPSALDSKTILRSSSTSSTSIGTLAPTSANSHSTVSVRANTRLTHGICEPSLTSPLDQQILRRPVFGPDSCRGEDCTRR